MLPRLFAAVCAILLVSGGEAATESVKAHHIAIEADPRLSSSFSPTTIPAQSRSGQQLAYAQPREAYVGGGSPSSGGYSTVGGGAGGVSGSSYGAPASAASSAYGTPGQGGQNPQGSMTYYYYHYPAGQGGGGQQGGNGGGWGAEPTGYSDDEGGFDGGALGGLGGLAGLLGLKGVKGLGGLGLLALFKLLKPLLLPLLLPFLLLLPLLLLFIPIPVITIPTGTGRSLEASDLSELLQEKVYSGVQMAQDVLTSGQCIERISCEINKNNPYRSATSLLSGVFEKTESYLPKKWRRGMRAFVESSEGGIKCSKYNCDLYKIISRNNSSSSESVNQIFPEIIK